MITSSINTAVKTALSPILFATSLWITGCSSGPPEPPRFPVSGTVTMNGTPLPEGKINFITPAQGVIETLEVKDGKFEGKAQAGERRVEINSYKVEVVNKDGMQSEAQIELVPQEYNKDSKLVAQVTEEGPNNLSFDVKSN